MCNKADICYIVIIYIHIITLLLYIVYYIVYIITVELYNVYYLVYVVPLLLDIVYHLVYIITLILYNVYYIVYISNRDDFPTSSNHKIPHGSRKWLKVGVVWNTTPLNDGDHEVRAHHMVLLPVRNALRWYFSARIAPKYEKIWFFDIV